MRGYHLRLWRFYVQILTAPFLIMILFIYGFAHATENCVKPEGVPCAEFSYRLHALKKLQNNANDVGLANQNYAVVEAVRAKLDLPLDETIDQFNTLQTALDDLSFGFRTRKSFLRIAAEVNPQNNFKHVAGHFISLFQVENSLEETHQSLTLLMDYARKNQLTLQDEVADFISLMELEGGEIGTRQAQSSFKKLAEYSDRYAWKDLVSVYLKVRPAENDHRESLGNFDLIILAADKCGRIKQASEDFLRVFALAGGDIGTMKAREVFKKLYGI